LRTGVKRRHAGALMLRFVVACGGSGVIVNGQGGIGAAAVECVRAFASGEGACDGDSDVGVAKAVGDDRVVVAAAAVDGGVEGEGVDDTRSKSGVAAAAAAGVALAVGVVGVKGAGGVSDAGSDSVGVEGTVTATAVGVGVGFVVGVGVVTAGDGVGVDGTDSSDEGSGGDGVVLVKVWGLRGASDVGGTGLGAAEVKGVR